MALQFVPRCPAPGADGLRPSKLGAPWHIQGGGLFAMVCQGGEGMLEGAMATRVTAKNRGPPLHPTPVAPLGGSGALPSALGGGCQDDDVPPATPQLTPNFCLAAPGVTHVIVREDPYRVSGDQMALGLLAGAATGAALGSFMWMPCWF